MTTVMDAPARIAATPSPRYFYFYGSSGSRVGVFGNFRALGACM